LSAWIDKEDDKKPNFGERFALAQKLALSIHQIHTSGWLHKNIYSTNIAFFSNASEEFRLDFTYIIAFGKARPDNDRPRTNSRTGICMINGLPVKSKKQSIETTADLSPLFLQPQKFMRNLQKDYGIRG
jgi:hypothetical protein